MHNDDTKKSVLPFHKTPLIKCRLIRLIRIKVTSLQIVAFNIGLAEKEISAAVYNRNVQRRHKKLKISLSLHTPSLVKDIIC